jgi:hypothetical protein
MGVFPDLFAEIAVLQLVATLKFPVQSMLQALKAIQTYFSPVVIRIINQRLLKNMERKPLY